ncbi:MAG TPA: hypothetical protein VGE84_02615 [Allosphingosinicella sp.]
MQLRYRTASIIALSAALSTAGAAQHLDRPRLARSSPLVAPSLALTVHAHARTPLWPFVVGGMVAGGVTSAVWYSRHENGTTGALAPASGIFVLGLGMGAGALGGTALGLVVRGFRDR